jgi:hypothetical protein
MSERDDQIRQNNQDSVGEQIAEEINSLRRSIDEQNELLRNLVAAVEQLATR